MLLGFCVGLVEGVTSADRGARNTVPVGGEVGAVGGIDADHGVSPPER